MDKHTKTYELVSRISSFFNCSNRMIASLLGVTDSTLSSNLTKNLNDIETKKTGKRLLKLSMVVLGLQSEGLGPKAVLEILTTPVFRDYKGNNDSVKSAIINDKYELETLMVIAESARTQYVAKQVAEVNDYVRSLELEDYSFPLYKKVMG